MRVESPALTAGQKFTITGGNFFMLVSTSSPVDVTFIKGGAPLFTALQVEAGYKAFRLGDHADLYFDAIEILSTVGQTIKYGLSVEEGGYDRSVGSVTATMVQGTTVAESSVTCPVADTEYTAAAANSSRKVVRFYNPSTNTGEIVVYGTPGTSRANAVEHILPGGMISESDGAPATWYCKAQVAGEALKIQIIT